MNGLTDELNGTAKKVNACAIRVNSQQKQDNEANVLAAINAVENILATRFAAESFNDLFDALKTLNRSKATDDDVKKALVSSQEKRDLCLCFEQIADNLFVIGILVWIEKYR